MEPGDQGTDQTTTEAGGDRVGQIIGAYEIVEELGAGGVGVVYRARHGMLGRDVALKVLHRYWTSDPEFLVRFQDEGRLTALLEHPNILRVYDAGEHEGAYYLAMAYIDGQTLEELMREDEFPESLALDISRQICEALAYAHDRGVVHRDVKPSNIIVDGRGRAILTDFGVARLLDSPTMTLPGMQIGTPFYMSPEQVRGEPVDGRTDIYSLGVVLYQMLSGDLPFPMADVDDVLRAHQEKEPPPLPEDVPNWLAEVVMKALAKAPPDRFATAQEMSGALRAASDTPTPLALDSPPLARQVSLPRGSRKERPPEGPMVRQELTCLALDIAGSSRLKKPGETIATQRQFGAFRDFVREKLEAYDCLNYAWAGDGLLGLFAQASQGSECALAIVADLGAFNAQFSQQGQHVRLRIGVHTGPVLMSESQPLGEVVSSTLDVAGHLQKDSPEDTAAITETTFQALEDRSAWELLGATRNGQWYCYRSVDAARALPRMQPLGDTPPTAKDETPAAAAEALKIEISLGSSRAVREIADEALIGRPDIGVVPDIDLSQDDAVSRRHARIFRGEDGFYVEDLGSSNGTLVNEETLAAREPRRLQPGDLIEIGADACIRVLEVP